MVRFLPKQVARVYLRKAGFRAGSFGSLADVTIDTNSMINNIR